MMKIIMMIFFICFLLNWSKMFFVNLMFLMAFFLIFNMGDNDCFLSISYYFGVDMYSLVLMIMSIWIIGLMLLSLSLKENDSTLKIFVFLLILKIIMFFFFSLNIFMFYFFFEVSLIPMFMLIIYWGMNPERLSAAYYLMIYTLFFSFPMLFYIIQLYKNKLSLNFSILIFEEISISWVEYIMFLGALFVKMPIYILHIWLPKAHVEAPVYGSMILAAILLKLGSYGLIRFSQMLYFSMIKMNYLIISVSLVGSLIVSFMCMNQVDMKMMVAYSSVVHMNFMNSVILIMNKISMNSSLIMMISHGLCSSGLFFMVGMFYNCSSSRLLIFNKGMLNFIVSFMMGWFYLCMANFSFPLSMNFFSEIFMMMMIVSWEFKLIFMIMFIGFFSSIYSLILYSMILHGNSKLMEKMDVSMKELLIIFIHCYPMLMFMFNMMIFY